MAHLVTAASPAAALSSAPRTTTVKTLWVLCVALLVATTVVFGTSLWVFSTVHSTVETVRTSTAPAILGVLAAQDALGKADSAAIGSFQSGEIKLSGPGLQYQYQLTFASQSLTQVAEHNAAGPPGSQRIQLLEGLLESYSDLVGQAHSHSGTAVGIADLWSASRLLHAGDSPIVQEFNELLGDQQRTLKDQVSSSAMTTVKLLVWVIPTLVLFMLLVVTQVFLRRRFRRTLNPLLLLATVTLVGLSMVTSLVLVSQHRLETTRDTLEKVAQQRKADTAAADAIEQRVLGQLVMTECSHEKDRCGPTINQFITSLNPAGGPIGKDHNRRVIAWTSDVDVDKQISPAARNSHFWFLIPLAAALIAVLIPFGLWPRIEEYRYRPR